MSSLHHPRLRPLLAALLLAAVAGCGTQKTVERTSFDLGPLTGQPAAAATVRAQGSVLSALSVADVETPAWLDNTGMHYRLMYSDTHETRPYANSRWTMPPAALVGQRLKWRVAQTGGAVLNTADSRANVLQVAVDDFSQSFTSPADSQAQLALRATVLAGRKLVAQRTFVQSVPAAPNAAGSAAALSQATDRALDEMLTWLAALPAATASASTTRP
jgi:cholesterol transport system auxiliary component